MIKAIVFDLWNTLAYIKEGVTINELKKELKLEDVKPIEVGLMMRKFENVEEAMINLCNYLKIKPKKKLLKRLEDLWEDTRVMLSLFDDVIPVLQDLKKRYKLGLISNTDYFAIKEFEKSGFFEVFDVKLFSFDTGLLKPDPKVFRIMVDKLGIKPEEALMVGDSLNDDVLAAKKIGMDAILIKRIGGYSLSWEEKHTYKKTIKDLYELRDYLRKNG